MTEELITSELRGRGGAFFPTGRKWSFVPSKEQLPKPHYLVVNADESEPGSFKDNEILSRVPHRFIEGCLITAHAIDCDKVFVYIRGEYSGPYEILVAALEELKDRPEIRGDVTIVVHRGAGAYICGEETALLESLEGKRGQPRSKPPFPAISGLYASPTVVNNVETITTVPPVIAMGGAEYAKLGVDEHARHARRLGLRQRRERRQLRDRGRARRCATIIYDLGGGIPDGRELKAVVPGGSSTVILTKDEIDVGYDFDSLAQLRTAMGSAGIVVLDDRCCIVQLGIRFSEFYEHESCGKCTPCREGTRWLTAILRKLEDGRAIAGRPRPAARRLRPHQRQVPLPARRLGRDHRRELRREVPRRVPGAHRRGRLPVRRRARRSTTCSRPIAMHAIRLRQLARGARMADARHRHDRRADRAGAEGHRHGRDGRRRRDRDPRLLLRAAARAAGRRLPHVPRRGRRDAEAPGRLHAHARRTAWS